MQTCVICGKQYSNWSRKTCSRECYRVLRAQVNRMAQHKGVRQSPEARARNRARLQARAAELLEQIHAMPESQRGPQNRESQDWILVTPEGKRIKVHNLSDWCRRNADVFGKTVDDDHDAQVIRSGFAQVKRSLLGRLKPEVRTYKGWSLEVDGRSYIPRPGSEGVSAS